MSCIKFTVIKRDWILLALFIFLVAGCGLSQKEMMARDHLNHAIKAYAQAEADQNVTTYAQGPLMEAGNAIKVGEKASDYKEIDHQAYLAERKTQIAKTVTEWKMAEKEREALSEEQDQLIKKTKRQVDAKTRELELTKMEADMKTREAEKEIYDKSRELVWTKMEAELLARKAELYIEELSKLMVKQTDRGIIVTLGDVLFTTGKAALSPKADDKVDKLFEFMKKYDFINVLVEGYTDSGGSAKRNLALSQERADAVKVRLVNRGLSPDRITTRGYGKRYPVARNDTIAGRKKNRRVEVLLLREGVKPESKFRK
jgi:outer membrane protein OmpA-like peptidoglycan-associated protein